MPRKPPAPTVPAEHRYERFAAEYLVDLNATGAYRRACNPDATDRTAGTEGHRLLKNPKVEALVAEGRLRLMGTIGVSAERTVEEYRRIGFFDPRTVMEWDEQGVRFFPSDSLSPEAAAAIASVKCKRTIRRESGRDGDEIETVEIEMKFVPKTPALDALSKHLGLFRPDELKITGGGGVLVVPYVDAATWAAEAAKQQATHGQQTEGAG